MKFTEALPPDVPDSVVSALGFPRLQSQLLYNRGISSRGEALNFLSPSESDLHDPMLLPDMDLAVDLLRRAIRDGETIGVFGDFDIDGISGTAVAAIGLRGLGANVIPYIPDREDEGHGLNERAVRSLAERGVKTLVTVDCGATSDAETALARSLGVDCVITDHHTMFDLPKRDAGFALVNPKRLDSSYPYEHLTGVGLAYKLMQSVYEDAGREEPRELLELVALGTVGDVGALKGENRYFVAEGLRRMNRTRFAGLKALVKVARLDGRELDTGALSFQIIPRLNAPGRVADPGVSLNLLTTEDDYEARSMADLLDRYNLQRRDLTESGAEQAEAQIRRRWGESVPGVIMVGSRDWIPGILGLIASRLVDAHGRPAIAVSVGDQNSRASARSVPEFDILAAIGEAGDLLTRFGGHHQAAGFSAPSANLRALAEHFEAVSFEARRGGAQIDADMIASPSLVRAELYEFTRSLAPFGAECPQPVFVSGPMRVSESRSVGAARRGGLKMRLHDGESHWDAIAFGQGGRVSEAPPGAAVELVYSMEPNTWRGRTSLQLVVADFAAA